jgi:hypothetical protein
MRTIWKFTLLPDGGPVEMPIGATVLSTAFQGDDLRLWAIVNEDAEGREKRRFAVHGTGHTLPDDPGAFIGTALHPGGLVFHVFERR